MSAQAAVLPDSAPVRRRRYWPWVLGAVLLLAAGVWGGVSKRLSGEHPDTAHYAERQAGLPLAAGFLSYESVDAVIDQLAAKNRESVRRTLAKPADRSYPRHVLDTIVVSDFPLLATQGKLTLDFFNDRLYEITFEPDDPVVCAKALDRVDTQLKRDRNGRSEYTAGDRRVATNVDLAISAVGRSLRTQPYVLWQELRLVRQRDEWDRNFGGLPVRAR